MTNTEYDQRPAVHALTRLRAGALAGALTLGMLAAACGRSEIRDRIDPPAPAVDPTPGGGLPADYPAPDLRARPTPERAPAPGRSSVYRS